MCQVNSVLKNSAGAWNVVGAQRGGCSHNDWLPFSYFITVLSFTFLFYYYYYLDTRSMAFPDLIPNPKLLILYYILVLPECCLYHIVPRAQGSIARLPKMSGFPLSAQVHSQGREQQNLCSWHRGRSIPWHCCSKHFTLDSFIVVPPLLFQTTLRVAIPQFTDEGTEAVQHQITCPRSRE